MRKSAIRRCPFVVTGIPVAFFNGVFSAGAVADGDAVIGVAMLTARSDLWHADSKSADPVASSPALTELDDDAARAPTSRWESEPRRSSCATAGDRISKAR